MTATSQFYRKYRYEKQLVDSISVGNMSLNRAGLFYMVAQLDADKVEPFWQEFTRDLAALDAGKDHARRHRAGPLQL